MRPGRELDLMVAEVLGYTPLETFCSGEIEFFGDGRWYCLKCGFSCDEPGSVDFVHAERPEPYSTDISAAWQVWEWLEKKLPCRVLLGGLRATPSIIVLDKPDTFKNCHTFYGDTYPHAICLAALRVSTTQEVNG